MFHFMETFLILSLTKIKFSAQMLETSEFLISDFDIEDEDVEMVT